MTSPVNLTSEIFPEESQDGADTVMTLVFLGVLGITMTTLLSGTFWAWKKENKEKKTVKKLNKPIKSRFKRYLDKLRNWARLLKRWIVLSNV